MMETCERVTLPAGSCVYYMRNSEGLPFVQLNNRKGKLSFKGGKSPNTKELGELGPECIAHGVMEKEYAVIRKVVNAFTEQNVSEMGTENKHRAGGQIMDWKLLLANLATVNSTHESINNNYPLLPGNSRKEETRSENKEISHYKQLLPPQDIHMDLCPSFTLDLSPRCLALERHFVRNQKREMGKGKTVLPSSVTRSKTQDHFQDDSSKMSLFVHKKPLSSRDRKENEELERSFDLIRTTQQRYPTPDPSQSNRGNISNKIVIIQNGNDPLQRVSDRLSLEQRARRRTNMNRAGLTPSTSVRPESEVPSRVLPPSPTFQEHDRGRGCQEHWKPRVSRQAPDLSDAAEETALSKGSSIVTRVASKIILNLVLPQEGASSDVRMCERRQRATRQPLAHSQQPLQVWLSAPPLSMSSEKTTTALALQFIDSDDFANSFENRTSEVQEHDSPMRNTDTHIDTQVEAQTELTTHPMTPDDTGVCRYINHLTDLTMNANSDGFKTQNGTKTQLQEPLSGSLTSKKFNSRQSSCERAWSGTNIPLLGSHMTPAESTFHSSHQMALVHEQRVTHCDVFGPDLCSDCESTQHRRLFTSCQDLLFPRINVFPRRLVAAQKLKNDYSQSNPVKRDYSTGAGLQASGCAPLTSAGQLDEIVTEVDICKRITARGRKGNTLRPALVTSKFGLV